MNTNGEIKAKAIVKILEEVDDPELRDSLLRELTIRNGEQQENKEAPPQDRSKPPRLRERLERLITQIKAMPSKQKAISMSVMAIGIAILLISLYLISRRLGGLDLGTMKPDFAWLIMGVVALFIFRHFKPKR